MLYIFKSSEDYFCPLLNFLVFSARDPWEPRFPEQVGMATPGSGVKGHSMDSKHANDSSSAPQALQHLI